MHKIRFLGLAVMCFAHVYAGEFTVSKTPEDLVEVEKVIPDIILDIKYARADNFIKQVVYTSDRCFMRKEVADALVRVQADLAKEGLRLKVWDGFRPLEAQRKFWSILPDERYVSNPAKGGRHTRGTALDVTVCSKDGKELDMGTDFDDMSETAWRSCTSVSAQAQKNRALLEELMKKHGFEGLPTEWWHFDYKGWQSKSVLDVHLEDLN